MGLGYELLGFESVRDYGQALKGIPKDGAKRVFKRQSAGKIRNTILLMHLPCLVAPLDKPRTVRGQQTGIASSIMHHVAAQLFRWTCGSRTRESLSVAW
jgi:hypothetical protein